MKDKSSLLKLRESNKRKLLLKELKNLDYFKRKKHLKNLRLKAENKIFLLLKLHKKPKQPLPKKLLLMLILPD
jgi:hypothetical protein